MPGILIGVDGLWERNASPVAGTSAYTVLGYLRVSALPSGNEMVFWGEPSTGTYFIEGIAWRSDGSMRVEYYDNGAGGWAGQNIAMGGGGQPAVHAADTWYACAIVRSGDDLHIYRRVDGGGTELLTTINTSQTGRPSFASYRGVAGAHAQNYGYQLTRFYSRALTQGQIEAEWDALTPASATNLEADYQFANDGTDATRRADSSGNSRTLYAEVDSDWGASDLPLVFSVTPGAMSGSADGAATVSGNLTGSGALSGASAGAGATSGNLVGAGALAGAAAGVGSATGTAVGSGALSGVVAGTGAASGALTGAGALSGSASGEAASSATLAGSGALSGSASGGATVTGSLDGAADPGAMSGSSAGSATSSATLAGAGRLYGSAHGTSTAEIDNEDEYEFPDRYRVAVALVDTRPRLAVVETRPQALLVETRPRTRLAA